MTLWNIFNKDGTLTKAAIADAKFVQHVKNYNDRAPIKSILRGKGDLEYWIKARTQQFYTGYASEKLNKGKNKQNSRSSFL